MREISAPEHGPLLLPSPLQQGDTIGLFCPAGPVRDMESLKKGIDCLRDFGFRIKTLESLKKQIDANTYLSAPDTVRAQRLRMLWMDNEVKALMAVRGGYGCLRLLDRIDFTLFRDNPKLLIGFSDLTTLLAANCSEAGLIGLHGPVVTTLSRVDQKSRERFFSVLTGSYLPCPVTGKIKILRQGRGHGPLIIGNLTTLVHLIGTPYEPVFKDALLIIEDTGESMYRIDRMLTHLACGGRLTNLAGLILGSFNMGGNLQESDRIQQQLFDRVTELTMDSAYPVWGDFPVGHGYRNYTFPYGMTATMDSGQGLFSLHPQPVD
ncbi:MAG TPA: LD-carboxypeptidase [Desulfobulbaceae bacterium]|nr:LD-carboxypeptidase [Desulfobulbaceae bacterium]